MAVEAPTSQITRAEARTRGLPLYFTGLPCKRGHVYWQRTCNGGCVQCERIPSVRHRHRRNVKLWRKAQEPGALKEYRNREARSYRQRLKVADPEYLKARDKRSNDKRDPEAHRQYMRDWHKAHPGR